MKVVIPEIWDGFKMGDELEVEHQAKIKEMQEEFNSYCAKTQANCNHCAVKHTEKIEVLEGENVKLKIEVEQLKAVRDALGISNKNALADRNTFIKKAEVLVGENAKLLKRIEKLYRLNAEISTERSNLRERLEEKDKQIEKMKSDLGISLGELAKERVRGNNSQKIAVLEGENAQLKNELKETQESLIHTTLKCNQHWERLEAIRSLISDLDDFLVQWLCEDFPLNKRSHCYPSQELDILLSFREGLGVLLSPKELDQKTREGDIK